MSIVYKLAFFRLMFNTDMDSNIISSIFQITVSSMDDSQIVIMNNLKTLTPVKGGSHFINGFTTNKVNDLVNKLSVM